MSSRATYVGIGLGGSVVVLVVSAKSGATSRSRPVACSRGLGNVWGLAPFSRLSPCLSPPCRAVATIGSLAKMAGGGMGGV